MTTLLSHTERRAAHGKHRCQRCGQPIAARELYLDQRLADGGTAYTFRQHLACHSAYWSWVDHNDEDAYILQELTDGHLPPCPQAWAPPGYKRERPPWPPDTRGPCSCRAEMTP